MAQFPGTYQPFGVNPVDLKSAFKILNCLSVHHPHIFFSLPLFGLRWQPSRGPAVANGEYWVKLEAPFYEKVELRLDRVFSQLLLTPSAIFPSIRLICWSI